MTEEARQKVYAAPCQRCGSPAGLRSEDEAAYREGLIQIWCDGCKEAYRHLAHDVMTILEQHAGFTQEHRAALAHLAQLALNDPQEALTVQSLSQRVDGLEKEVRNLMWLLLAVVTVGGVIVATLSVFVSMLAL